MANLTVEAGGEAIFRPNSPSTAHPTSKLVDKTIKGCVWEFNGREIQPSSSRHFLSTDESDVSGIILHSYKSSVTVLAHLVFSQ